MLEEKLVELTQTIANEFRQTREAMKSKQSVEGVNELTQRVTALENRPATRGEKGDRGERGERGPQGTQGVAGAKGADGKSAYELAVQNGFRGTVQQWLESLKAVTDPKLNERITALETLIQGMTKPITKPAPKPTTPNNTSSSGNSNSNSNSTGNTTTTPTANSANSVDGYELQNGLFPSIKPRYSVAVEVSNAVDKWVKTLPERQLTDFAFNIGGNTYGGYLVVDSMGSTSDTVEYYPTLYVVYINGLRHMVTVTNDGYGTFPLIKQYQEQLVDTIGNNTYYYRDLSRPSELLNIANIYVVAQNPSTAQWELLFKSIYSSNRYVSDLYTESSLLDPL